MIHQSHGWVYTQKKENQYIKEISVLPHLLQLYSQQLRYKIDVSIQQWINS